MQATADGCGHCSSLQFSFAREHGVREPFHQSDPMQTYRLIATAGGALALSLAMTAAADAAPDDWRFYSGIFLYPGSGTGVINDRVFADQPITRSASSDSLPDMSGRTSVDLGVMRSSASAPAYQGQTGIFSAGAVVSYHDTMVFGQSGQGMIPVGFVFQFDGNLTGSTAAQVDLQMIVAGLQGSVTTPYGKVNFHTEGRFDDSDPGACETPTGVSPGFPQGYQCSVDNVYNFRRTGAKMQGVPFTFNILAGQAVDIYSLFLTSVFP